MGRLTLYIPTYNRSDRLKRNLLDLFHLIQEENLLSIIDILVGDNFSSDTTPDVLKDLSSVAEGLGINFKYFVNNTNLGFNGNIKQGYLRFEGDYVIYISDDDNLFPGALTAYAEIIFELQPSVALINFEQPPFTLDTPLYPENKTFTSFQTDFFKPLILFPKLTGLALKKPIDNLLREEIASVVIPSFAAAHMALAIYQYSKFGNGLHVSISFGYPDIDYLEHITFLPYVSNLSRIELEYALVKTGKIDETEILNGILELIPNRIVIDDSIYLLNQYFTFKTNLTTEAFSELWSNCLRYLFGRTQSKSGLSLSNSSRKFKRLKIFIIFLLMVRNHIFEFIGLKHVNLGEKGFIKK
jgi:glycosyltransferase involved in cell wall biosynthesis